MESKINLIKSLNYYEQMSFFIINTYKNNVLQKLPYADYYVRYIDKNI